MMCSRWRVKWFNRMGTKGRVWSETARRIDALKTFLTSERPISKRAAMYRLLSMGLLNSTKDFHNFNRAMNRALRNGERWDEKKFNDECFVDNKRRVELVPTWTDLEDYKQWCARIYRRNYWQDQPKHIEVWLEKDTTAFLVQEVTDRLGVPLRISAGHFSRGFLYRAAGNLAKIVKSTSVLYIGDFDPSGLDVERAAQRGRRSGMSEQKDGIADLLEKHFEWNPERWERQVTWRRVGVTEEDLHGLPEKSRVPIKEDKENEDGGLKKGDPRAEEFKAKYGEFGAEVEALEVLKEGLLAERLETAIWEHIDRRAWKGSEHKEKSDRHALAN